MHDGSGAGVIMADQFIINTVSSDRVVLPPNGDDYLNVTLSDEQLERLAKLLAEKIKTTIWNKT